MAAREYFFVLGKIIKPDFKFYGRNRRPPKDPFNSLLSFGYTLLMYEILSKVQTAGLNAYCGILHADRDNSPALASDLMEEWRPVLVDSTVMSMIQGNEISIDDFETDENHEGVYINNIALKKFIKKFEKKMCKKVKYLGYSDDSYSFREALNIQVQKISECIKKDRPELYLPIIIK